MNLKSDKKFYLLLLLTLSLTAFWGYIQVTGQTNEHHVLDIFAGLYGVVALFGGIWGLKIAKGWGGYKSVIGKALVMLSFGLLLQEFGQLSYAYYAVVKNTEVPYPSIGDAGYFGSVILYIYAATLINKAVGYKYNIKKLSSKTVAFVLPAAILLTSYLFFLRGYTFEWSQPLTVLLDFGYPLGQSLYIALILLAFLLSRKVLGGTMRSRILLIVFAFCLQYAADFNFLYQASHETWATAGYGDLLYLSSYVFMALAILHMNAGSVDQNQTTPKVSEKVADREAS